MRYRPHRGSLADAMKEVVEVQDLEALRDYLNDPKIVIKPYYDRYDPRIGWKKTYLVMSGTGGPLGFTDSQS